MLWRAMRMHTCSHGVPCGPPVPPAVARTSMNSAHRGIQWVRVYACTRACITPKDSAMHLAGAVDGRAAARCCFGLALYSERTALCAGFALLGRAAAAVSENRHTHRACAFVGARARADSTVYICMLCARARARARARRCTAAADGGRRRRPFRHGLDAPLAEEDRKHLAPLRCVPAGAMGQR